MVDVDLPPERPLVTLQVRRECLGAVPQDSGTVCSLAEFAEVISRREAILFRRSGSTTASSHAL
jgi:hypothetical protein